MEKLTNLGYTVFIFWECELKRKPHWTKNLMRSTGSWRKTMACALTMDVKPRMGIKK